MSSIVEASPLRAHGCSAIELLDLIQGGSSWAKFHIGEITQGSIHGVIERVEILLVLVEVKQSGHDFA